MEIFVIIIITIVLTIVSYKIYNKVYLLNSKSTDNTSAAESSSSDKYKDFDIEYMPISGRYYPRYEGKYLYSWLSGRYTLERTPEGCTYAGTKEGAIHIYNLYLEYKSVGTVMIKP